MSEELNARNITALSNAIRGIRVDNNDMLDSMKQYQSTIATLQAEIRGLKTQIGMLLAMRGGGPTSNGC